MVLLPVLATRCGVSFEALAAILAAGALAFLVAAPLFGRLSDRIGRSRVLMLAAGGIAAGQAVFGATAQAAAWGLLPVALVLIGLASGRIAYAAAAAGAMPVAQAHVADVVTPQERLGALASLGAATTTGRLLAPPLAALATLISPFAPLHLLSLVALGTAIAVARLPGRQSAVRSGIGVPSRALPGPVAAAMLVMLLVGMVQVSLGPWLEAGLGLQDLAASRWLGVLLGLAAAGALAAQLLVVPRVAGSRLAAFVVAGSCWRRAPSCWSLPQCGSSRSPERSCSASASHVGSHVKRHLAMGSLLIEGSVVRARCSQAAPSRINLTSGRRKVAAPISPMLWASGSGRRNQSQGRHVSARPRRGPPTRIQRGRSGLVDFVGRSSGWPMWSSTERLPALRLG